MAKTSLGQLATSHDRALIDAVAEVLPDLAARAAAGLSAPEGEAWRSRAIKLGEAVAGAGGG
jgi:hypothetical protein